MAFTKVAPAGIGSTPGDGYRIGDSFLHSTGVEITNINATGIVTAASLDISGAIDFDGQTNLDHVNIAGVTTTTDDIIIGADNKKLKLGVGEELQLYQAGNHSIIQHNGSHYLSLRSNAFNVMGASGTKSIFSGFPDTHSSMYYNGSYKIRTQNTGAEIVGTVVATGADINGDIDVDGHTELDNVNIAGIVTVSSDGINAGILDLKTGNNLRLRFSSGGTAQFRGDTDPIASFDRGSANSTNVKWGYLGADRGIISSISNEFRITASGTIPMTFHSNGNERLRINSDGKVGIATGTGSGLINTRHGGTNQQVLHVRADLGSSNGRSLNLYTPDTDNTNAPFRFQTGNGYLFQCDSEDVFTIAHDRTVGINTQITQNSAHFQHYQSSARHQSFQSTDGDLAIVSDNNSNPVVYVKGTGTADLVNVFDNTTEVFTIKDGGKFGFNDSDPERTMDVKGSNCMIQLEGTAGSGRQWSLCSTDNATGTAVDDGPSGTFAIYDDTDGQARLRINSNGNTKFLVSGGSFTVDGTGAYGISIHNHNSPSMGHLFIYGDNGLIRFRNTSNTYTAQMGYTESSNTLFFANQEGGTTMYITGDGVKLYDNNKFLCGNDNDLGIYHDNSNAYIENTSGSIYFRHSGSNKVEMKSAGGIKFHNQASGNFIQYSNSTVAPNAAINLQRYGNGYCDMRLSSNYGAKVLLAGASDNTDEFVMQQGNTKEAYINNEATGKHINIQIGGTTKLQIGDDAESVRVSGTSADHTGTTGQSKGLTLQYGGGYSVPLYFGNETDSAQKSMYLHGYWIYLRGHQNEGVRFVFSQGAGNAIRSEKFQFKYNSCLNSTNSTTWNTSSDARAKENVQTITNGIEIIKKLRPVTYDWTNDFADSQTMYIMGRDENGGTVAKKENGYDTDRKNGQMGFIAQEYETVLPKDVMKDTYKLGETELDDFRTMTNDSLLPSLTAALKEAIAKIEVLEAEVAALKGS